MAFQLHDGTELYPTSVEGDRYSIQRSDEDLLPMIDSFDFCKCRVDLATIIVTRRRVHFALIYEEDENGTETEFSSSTPFLESSDSEESPGWQPGSRMPQFLEARDDVFEIDLLDSYSDQSETAETDFSGQWWSD